MCRGGQRPAGNGQTISGEGRVNRRASGRPAWGVEARNLQTAKRVVKSLPSDLVPNGQRPDLIEPGQGTCLLVAVQSIEEYGAVALGRWDQE